MNGLDCMATKDREFEIDLENGSNTSEEDLNSETESISKPHSRKTFGRLRSGFLCTDGSTSGGSSFASSSSSSKLVKLGVDENDEYLMDKSSDEEKRREHGALAEKKKKNVIEKMKTNGKVHKPPRPPRGPSLDAADRIFVKEIAELAVKKRATVERAKALKKKKAEKTSSFNSSLTALFVTLLFFVIIIFQGMSAKGCIMALESHVPSIGGRASLITDQHSSKPSSKVNEHQSCILNFAGKQTSDPATIGEASTVEDLKNH